MGKVALVASDDELGIGRLRTLQKLGVGRIGRGRGGILRFEQFAIVPQHRDQRLNLLRREREFGPASPAAYSSMISASFPDERIRPETSTFVSMTARITGGGCPRWSLFHGGELRPRR